jgi:hypothetical protein
VPHPVNEDGPTPPDEPLVAFFEIVGVHRVLLLLLAEEVKRLPLVVGVDHLLSRLKLLQLLVIVAPLHLLPLCEVELRSGGGLLSH